ncbi:DUF1018 domain-containing protein [Roseibium aggregatum]|uniref:regulatory protein GemA n=1 Tax=Roseibium aggregatum TaxID=187304 RepID=UPI001E3B90E0|nr:regulatory protein GemA [Roseibium aggregatum]UES58525.1 DUF1018 domain-containing protein [Roseibium aggregatum]
MNAYAKIHVLKRNANLDDDTYRDLLERETGKRSCKGMAQTEQLQVISALQKLLPEQDPNAAQGKRATGKYAKKLQALWIAGHNLGVIANKSDEAMIAFLKRQTGLDHHRFLQDGKAATKAIDALKLWIRRATQNYDLFTQDQNQSPLLNDFRFQVCLHIWAELVRLDKAPMKTLTTYMVACCGRDDPGTFNSNDWIQTMNRLGKLYRAVKK